MNNNREGIYRVIKYVASPLHFFALIIVSLAFIIVMLAWKSTLPSDLTFRLIITAFVVLLGIIILVTILFIFFPKKLVFDKEAHLTMLREQLGDNEITGSLSNIRAIDANRQIGPNKS